MVSRRLCDVLEVNTIDGSGDLKTLTKFVVTCKFFNVRCHTFRLFVVVVDNDKCVAFNSYTLPLLNDTVLRIEQQLRRGRGRGRGRGRSRSRSHTATSDGFRDFHHFVLCIYIYH